MILQQSILMERAPARIPSSNSTGEAIFTFLFMESTKKGSTKAQIHLPCLHWQHKWLKRALHLDVWSHWVWHTQPLTRHPSSTCSLMLPSNRAQLTSTTTSVYCSVVLATLPTKPDLDCLRWAQVKPWHQCHRVFAVRRSWKFWPGG